MAGAAAAAVASGISARPAALRRAPAGRRARVPVVRAAISVEKGEKAYTVQKSEQIFNAAKVPSSPTISICGFLNAVGPGSLSFGRALWPVLRCEFWRKRHALAASFGNGSPVEIVGLWPIGFDFPFLYLFPPMECW